MHSVPNASVPKPASIAGRVARGLAIGAATVGCLSPQIVTAGPIGPTLAPITWGTATTISGDSDVDTTGTLTYAYNFGSNSSATTQTVNGVTFSPFVITYGSQSVTQGSVTVSEDPGNLYSNLNTGSVSGSFAGLSAAYRGLLSSEVYSGSFETITVDLAGLTSGHTYRLQWWSNDSGLNAFSSTRFFDETSSTGNSGSATLDSNTTNAIGGLGQYVIGTFTATGSTASFTLTGSGVGAKLPLMNALQLRDTSAAVPEIDPAGMGSVVAIVSGVLGLLERRRMKMA